MNEAQKILEDVANTSKIPLWRILSKDRTDRVVTAREIAAKRMRQIGMTLEDIGEAINRNHATVIHLIEKRKPNGIRHKKNQQTQKTPSMMDLLIAERNKLTIRLAAITKLIDTYEK
jgi:chromosomal replication initiation ATPase DnaA